MKAKIEIEFEKIADFEINEELLLKEPNLIYATEQTMKKLCKELPKYFEKHHIKINVRYNVMR